MTRKKKYTALHFASHRGHDEIVELLLNVFSEDEKKDQLTEYVMNEDENQFTALHLASDNGHEKIVKLLLNAFHVEEKYTLI